MEVALLLKIQIVNFMKSLDQHAITTSFACIIGALLLNPLAAHAEQLAKNGLRIPYTIAVTATTEIEGSYKEWEQDGTYYIKETTKLNVYRVGNKQLLEILLEQDVIPDGTISGWSLVEYLQTSGSSEDEDMFQQGAFLVKMGRDPIDVNEHLGYTLSEREVESGEETYGENNGFYTKAAKNNGQGIGEIYFEGNTIGSGLAKYINSETWDWTYTEESYDLETYSWTEIPQSFSISGICGWVESDGENDDPYGYEDEEEEAPVLIQGSIKAGKGTAIRLPKLADDSYYPY